MINLCEDEIIKNWEGDIQFPLVSITTITFNQEKYISDTLDSILTQKTSFPFEILIHDDCSTDSTAEIIRQYEKKYPNIIKPIYEEKNVYSVYGFSKIEKIQMERANGKYIAVCEGDDYWIDENKLQMQVDFLENNPEYGMCFSNVKIISGEQVFERNSVIKHSSTVSVQKIIKEGGMFVPSPTIMYRYSLLEDYPDFCSQCWVGDYPHQIFISLKSKVFYFNIFLAAYRTHAVGSWTSKIQGKSFQEKRLGIESELRMLNGLNEYSNFQYNKAFMLRKIHFIGENINDEKELVFKGKNVLMYKFYAFLLKCRRHLSKYYYRIIKR